MLGQAVREQPPQQSIKGEEGALWPKSPPNLYSPYTTFGIKSLER
jgi:hypothetical protein